MKTSLLVWVLLAMLLSGCNSGDDLIIVGSRVISNYGDDLVLNAQRVASNSALNSGDDYARGISHSLDEILLNKQMGQTVDDIARQLKGDAGNIFSRGSTVLDTPPPRVLYSIPTSQWSDVQRDMLADIGVWLSYNEEEAGVFLETTCWVADYIQINGNYPSSEYSQFYVQMQVILDQFTPPQMDAAEFAAKSVEFVVALIKGQGEVTPQQAAGIVFDGICLLPD